MHILFVTSELASANVSTGGLGTFTANMASIFADYGHNVEILVITTKEHKYEFDKRIKVENIFVPKSDWEIYNNISNSISDVDSDFLRHFCLLIYKTQLVSKRISEINRDCKIDIVHYCNLQALSLFADKNIPYVIRVSGFRSVLEEANKINCNYDNMFKNMGWYDQAILNAMRNSQYIIAPSMLYKKMIEDRLEISKVDVLESPFIQNKEKWEYTDFDSYFKEKKYILFYGTLNCNKGVHVIADLSEQFLESHPDISLALVGASTPIEIEEGKYIQACDYVKQKAGEYSDRVICVDRVCRQKLNPIIDNALLCLFPSRIDNLPNACIEAMSMGKIVVATNGASCEQLIKDGVNGFLRERDNPDSFLEGIERVLALREEEKGKMSQNAKQTVERLTPGNIYEQYLNYYQKVIKEW